MVIPPFRRDEDEFEDPHSTIQFLIQSSILLDATTYSEKKLLI
jgi:hypothetical protein